MTIEEQVLEKLRELPPEKQREVLDFVHFLREKNGTNKPLHNLRGLWKHINIDISEEEIAEARHEMWGNFPRENECGARYARCNLVPHRLRENLRNGLPAY